jgi:hypothetical protein
MVGAMSLVLFTCLSCSAVGHTTPTIAPTLHFNCNIGYSARDCEVQLRRLQNLLANLDLARLGDWTWILVRSQDWKPILRRVGRDPDSPAFTILEKRQTFLEEALFVPRPDRSRTLLEKWRITLDQLLAFAVTHELGHALCYETNEARTNAYAAQLRSTGRITCSGQADLEAYTAAVLVTSALAQAAERDADDSLAR